MTIAAPDARRIFGGWRSRLGGKLHIDLLAMQATPRRGGRNLSGHHRAGVSRCRAYQGGGPYRRLVRRRHDPSRKGSRRVGGQGGRQQVDIVTMFELETRSGGEKGTRPQDAKCALGPLVSGPHGRNVPNTCSLKAGVSRKKFDDTAGEQTEGIPIEDFRVYERPHHPKFLPFVSPFSWHVPCANLDHPRFSICRAPATKVVARSHPAQNAIPRAPKR